MSEAIKPLSEDTMEKLKYTVKKLYGDRDGLPDYFILVPWECPEAERLSALVAEGRTMVQNGWTHIQRPYRQVIILTTDHDPYDEEADFTKFDYDTSELDEYDLETLSECRYVDDYLVTYLTCTQHGSMFEVMLDGDYTATLNTDGI